MIEGFALVVKIQVNHVTFSNVVDTSLVNSFMQILEIS